MGCIGALLVYKQDYFLDYYFLLRLWRLSRMNIFQLILNFSNEPNISSLPVLILKHKTGFKSSFGFLFSEGIVIHRIENGTRKRTRIEFKNLIVDFTFMCMKVFWVAVQCTEFLWLQETQYFDSTIVWK